MDSTLHNPMPAPSLDLVTTFWRIVGPSHCPLTCALYRTAAGLELRNGYDHGDLVRSTRVESEGEAATVAAHWKAATVAVGSFVDLDAPES